MQNKVFRWNRNSLFFKRQNCKENICGMKCSLKRGRIKCGVRKSFQGFSESKKKIGGQILWLLMASNIFKICQETLHE